MAIVGVGVDVVDVARFEAMLARTPGLRRRLLGDGEEATDGERFAARFAAKEAVHKALAWTGAPRWHDVRVGGGGLTVPRVDVSGAVAERAAALGVTTWWLSLAHDGGVAIAMVVAESS
jgi:holo-[acyl-carrier protein] synthase